MSFLQIITSDDSEFHVSSDELNCSKFLMRVAGDLFLVTRVNLPSISSEVFKTIHKFMKLRLHNPTDDWLTNFIKECSDLSSLLQASHFFEIDELTAAISESIAQQISKCTTITEVLFYFLISNI